MKSIHWVAYYTMSFQERLNQLNKSFQEMVETQININSTSFQELVETQININLTNYKNRAFSLLGARGPKYGSQNAP